MLPGRNPQQSLSVLHPAWLRLHPVPVPAWMGTGPQLLPGFPQHPLEAAANLVI